MEVVALVPNSTFLGGTDESPSNTRISSSNYCSTEVSLCQRENFLA